MRPSSQNKLQFNQWMFWFFLLFLVQIIQISPSGVTWLYSQGAFRQMSKGLRLTFSQIPFSVGELVYIFIIILLIINSLKYVISLKATKSGLYFWKTIITMTCFKILQLYVVFQLIWGLNYHQSSPASQFKLVPSKAYNEVALDKYSLQLIAQMNQSRQTLPDSLIRQIANDLPTVKATVLKAYDRIAEHLPFLTYQYPNIKFARFPSWGDHLGYLAFYQPITGEAIIRNDLPILVQPFTIAHEIAHQLGYASETEANFIAYVVAIESNDTLLEYAMQLQLFTYCQEAELLLIAKRGDYAQWKKVVERNRNALSPQVLKDRKEIKQFFLDRQEKMIPGATAMYDQFLQWNKQARGLESYNDVLLWALAYEQAKKNP